MRILLAVSIVLPLNACIGSGKLDYSPPTSAYEAPKNATVVPRSREVTWQAAIPELGKKFFVINNLDKLSGLINVSYSGDPEKYIDCGRITSYVKDTNGERTYAFEASKAQQRYEVMVPTIGLFRVDRSMNLEGRINLVFEEISPGITQITANTRYIVKRSQVARTALSNFPQTVSDSISFNSNADASFPADLSGRATKCIATGTLETEVLSIFR